jgi:hypothetical protein
VTKTGIRSRETSGCSDSDGVTERLHAFAPEDIELAKVA